MGRIATFASSKKVERSILSQSRRRSPLASFQGIPLRWTLLPGAWLTIKSRAVFASCTTGRGPNGSSASQIRQARTSRNRRFSDIKSLSKKRHMFFRVRGHPLPTVSKDPDRSPSFRGPNGRRDGGCRSIWLFEELEGFEPGDRSGLWSITLLVGEVRKGVTGAIVDFNIDSFSSSVHTPFERSNFVGRNPAIERAENPQHTGVDFLNVPDICWQRAVIHNTSGKLRFMNRELNRQASA